MSSTKNTNHYLKTLGVKMYQFRKRRGLTQRQMADRLDVAQSYIAMLESGRGEREPSLSFLVEAANLMNSGIDGLLGINATPGSVTAFDGLSEVDRDLVERLAGRLCRIAKWESVSDSVRAIGPVFADMVEDEVAVQLSPKVNWVNNGDSDIVNAIQQELLQLP